jgi:hypothetical protein
MNTLNPSKEKYVIGAGTLTFTDPCDICHNVTGDLVFQNGKRVCPKCRAKTIPSNDTPIHTFTLAELEAAFGKWQQLYDQRGSVPSPCFPHFPEAAAGFIIDAITEVRCQRV